MKDHDPFAGEKMSNTSSASASAGMERMASGAGAAESHMVRATREGKFPNDNTSGQRSQGETPGSGSIYAAVLVERPNLSSTRNRGPEREPSRMGSSAIPIMTMADRNTGRKS